MHKNLYFEPKTVLEGSKLNPLYPPCMAPGVWGYAIKKSGKIYIPLIEGKHDGSVGNFLDHLSPRCVIVNVCNPLLREMLERRGWTRSWVDGCDQWSRQDRKE